MTSLKHETVNGRSSLQNQRPMSSAYTKINIYYCMTGRAIQGNIQFECGSIGPTAGRDST